MTTLRNIWADLVEKRLWPVAILLAGGLVAVPVVLAKRGDEPPPPSAAETALVAHAAGKSDTVVALDTAPQVRRHDGRGRDPFVQPKGSEPTKAQALQSSTTDAGAAAAGGGDSSGQVDVVAPQKKPASKSKPAPSGPNYTVDLRFGQADSMKTLRDVARLTPLPSASSPFFVFLGAKSDGKTLVFLVSSDAKATGDGTCKPSAKDCETIELRAGDTEFFDLTTADGVEQYQMDIIKVQKAGGAKSSGKSASVARAHASKAQRRMLRKVNAGRSSHLMGSYRWSPRRGVLVHVPAWTDDRAPTTVDGPADGTPSTGTSQD